MLVSGKAVTQVKSAEINMEGKSVNQAPEVTTFRAWTRTKGASYRYRKYYKLLTTSRDKSDITREPPGL